MPIVPGCAGARMSSPARRRPTATRRGVPWRLLAAAVGLAVLAACGGGADDDVGGVAIEREPGRAPTATADAPVVGGTPSTRPSAGTVPVVRPLGADALPDGANGWRITYRSEGVAGGLVEVSGVIYAPDAEPPDGGRPIVSWGHPPSGVSDECAPADLGMSVPYLEAFLDAGYVVAATDYEGLGTEGTHPFLVGESGARSMLDIARAARDLDELTGAGSRVVALGHLQGAQAALFAARLAASYTPDLELAGVVAGAPAANLRILAASTSASAASFGYFAMTVEGFSAAYPELAPDDLLTPHGIESLAVVRRGCADEVVAWYSRTDVAELVAASPLEHPDWSARIAENSIDTVPAEVPVLVVQGADDEVFEPVLADVVADELCANGGHVGVLRSPGSSHFGVWAAEEQAVTGWVAAAFAGTVPPSSC